MTHAAVSLPYSSFSKAIWSSSYLDSAFGIYKRGYHFWRWYAGANTILQGDVKNNVAWVGAGEAVNLATKYLGGVHFYKTFARTVAIAFYAIEALEHMYKTWEDIGKMVEALREKEPACVIDLINPPAWVGYIIDPETGRWLMTSLYLIAIKTQRVAGAILIVTGDIFFVPYYMWRVQDAYLMDNFFEEEACKGMALLHAKLLVEKIGRYRDLATTKNENKVTELVNTILGASSTNIKIDDATKVAEKMNVFLLKNDKTEITFLGRLANDAGKMLLGIGKRENSLVPMPKKKPQETPKLKPDPFIINHPLRPNLYEVKRKLN